MKFKITKNDGLKYSKSTGDSNKIHIDDRYALYTIFGEKICHGTLVIQKVFHQINLDKIVKNQNNFCININFYKHFRYNSEITIKKNKFTYHVFQDNNKTLELKFTKKNYYKLKNFSKANKLITFNNKYINITSQTKNIFQLLNNISKYAGTTYSKNGPLIKSININFDKNLNLSKKKNIIKSKKVDVRFPLIENILSSKKFIIEFITFEKPVIKNNKKIITELLQARSNLAHKEINLFK